MRPTHIALDNFGFIVPISPQHSIHGGDPQGKNFHATSATSGRVKPRGNKQKTQGGVYYRLTKVKKT